MKQNRFSWTFKRITS